MSQSGFYTIFDQSKTRRSWENDPNNSNNNSTML